jgi:hypothetical protein
LTESTKPPQPSAEHRLLDAFVGTWTTEGHQLEGAGGPAATITATQTYEWLSGGFFLVHRFDGRVGSGDASCIEIIGYDSKTGSYPVHTFYNNGVTNQWQCHKNGGTWSLTGSWSGNLMQVRCTTVFQNHGDTMVSKWESSSDGATWRTFWDVKATKLKE